MGLRSIEYGLQRALSVAPFRCIVLIALAVGCSSGESDDPLAMPHIVAPETGGRDFGIAGSPAAGEPTLGGSTGFSDPPDIEAGQTGSGEAGALQTAGGASGASGKASGEAGEGGEAGMGFVLPAECPGVAADYTSVVVGDDAGQVFDDEQLAGRVLVLGGAGDDVFLASPPGAGDCLLGGGGSDRFETAYLSAPSVFVGGEGDDVFVLRGSADTDVAYISDFKTKGNDQIHLDAMAYGLTFVDGAPLATEVVSVPGFSGGNSTAGDSARVLYDPETGGLWYDSDAGGTVATAVQIAVVQNFSSYSFDLNDFALE